MGGDNSKKVFDRRRYLIQHLPPLRPTHRALVDAGVLDRLLQQSLVPSPSQSPCPPNNSMYRAATKVQFLSVLGRSLLTAPGVFLPHLQR